MGDGWDKTREAVRRVSTSPGVEAQTYQGRHIIGRDTPIDGGIYLSGSAGREAIVVDTSKARILRGLIDKVEAQTVGGEEQTEKQALLSTYNTVLEAFPNIGISDDTDSLAEELNFRPDQPVNLGVYVARGVADCRQIALTNAMVLEGLKKRGVINGDVSVDRNKIPGAAHAWARYTRTDGKVYILDQAQDFVGSLEKSVEGSSWDYHRPEDNR